MTYLPSERFFPAKEWKQPTRRRTRTSLWGRRRCFVDETRFRKLICLVEWSLSPIICNNTHMQINKRSTIHIYVLGSLSSRDLYSCSDQCNSSGKLRSFLVSSYLAPWQTHYSKWQRVRTRWVLVTRTRTRQIKILPIGLPVSTDG